MKLVLYFSLITAIFAQGGFMYEMETEDMVIIEPDQDQNARDSRQYVNVRDRKKLKQCSPMPTFHKCNYDGIVQFIVGGHETEKNGYPFMAAIMKIDSQSNQPEFFCGGSLIDESHILTAAHCIEKFNAKNIKNIRIYLGTHDISYIHHWSLMPSRRVHKVTRIIKHKDFDYPRNLANDIAILTLETPAKMSKSIQTVCLPNYDMSYVGENLTVAGWGSLLEAGSLYSKKLNAVDVTVLSNAKCAKKLDKYGSFVTSTMMCAAKQGKGPCTGDSGGPLFTKRNAHGKSVQLGIVSWGAACAHSHYPSVYSNVSKMLGWIRRIQSCY